MKIISEQVSQREIDIIMRELRKVLSADISGDIVELGCYVGTTSLFISEYLKQIKSGRSFHVYDSFAGLPDKASQDNSPAGMQFKTGELMATKSGFVQNYKKANLPLPIIHKCWFEDLTDSDLPEKISFAFLDGDYYSSIKSSLKVIEDKMNNGGVIIVDDYANEALPGAQKAVDEWLKNKNHKLKVEASLAIVQLIK